MEGILEGLLYVQGDTGLTLKEVMSILDLTEEEAKELVYKLKTSYEEFNVFCEDENEIKAMSEFMEYHFSLE